MAMYALALVPMIAKLSNVVKQIWYADDAAAAGLLTDGICYVILVLNLVILLIPRRLF